LDRFKIEEENVEKIFLESYNGATLDELLAMKATHRIDSLVLAFEQALDIKPRQELSKPERVVLAVEALEREVNNGGYNQFFLNSSNEFTPFIVEALELIGCPKCAATTNSAIAVLNLSAPFAGKTVDESSSSLEDLLEKRLDEADTQYYANDENIAESLFAYIEKHSNEIHFPPAN
jgi:hypothetical protein